jgi:hypothetical protein
MRAATKSVTRPRRRGQASSAFGGPRDRDRGRSQAPAPARRFRPHRAADRETEEGPMRQAPAAQKQGETRNPPAPRTEAGQIMIELGCGKAKEVETVNNEHRCQCAALANQPSRTKPQARSLAKRNMRCPRLRRDQRCRRSTTATVVICRNQAAIHAIGECFDEIERQVGIEKARKDGPQNGCAMANAPKTLSGRFSISAVATSNVRVNAVRPRHTVTRPFTVSYTFTGERYGLAGGPLCRRVPGRSCRAGASDLSSSMVRHRDRPPRPSSSEGHRRARPGMA